MADGQEQHQAQMFRFDIGAGSLRDVLTRFSDVSGIQLVYTSDLVKGLQSSGLKGEFSVVEGLAHILAGSGVSSRFMSAKTVALMPESKQTRVLGPVRVEGAEGTRLSGVNGSSDVTATEGTGSYTSSALTIASKTAQSMKDTARSVSVVTQQRMRDQNITDFNSLMQQSTGITVLTESDPLAPVFYSRGFKVQQLQIDGGAPFQIGSANDGDFALIPQLDLSVYDHAEILRGADGLFNGYGSPGGVISLARKHPLNRGQIGIEAQTGSWNNKRISVDLTGPLGFDDKLRGRAVLTYQDQDFYYDLANLTKTVAYGMLEYELPAHVIVSAGLNSTRQDGLPFFGGLPRYQTGADLNLPRSTCLCFAWNRNSVDSDEIFAGLKAPLGANWDFKLNVSTVKQQRSRKYAASSGTVNPVTLAGPKLSARMDDRATDQQAVDATLNGGFELFGQRQQLVIGMNTSREDGGGYKGYTTPNVGSVPIDVLHFDRSAPGFLEPAAGVLEQYIPKYSSNQAGAYANAVITFWKPLHLNLGLRFSHNATRTDQYIYCTTTPSCNLPTRTVPFGGVTSPYNVDYRKSDFSWPPSWSLSYDLTRTVTLYGSYHDIYQDQSTYVDSSLQPLEPITGFNLETGGKWSGRDGKLNASLSLYYMKQNNFGVFSGDRGPGDKNGLLADGVHTCCYLINDNRANVSFGTDLEVNGEVMPGWQLSTGYTYNHNEQKGLYFGADNGKPLVSKQPQHLLKIFTTYQFSGDEWLRRLSVGGGANAQTKGYFTGTVCVLFLTRPDGSVVCDNAHGGSVQYEFTQGMYAVFSARASYKLTSTWDASLNVDNLTDRTYYKTVGTASFNNWYGAPRSYMLAFHGKF